LLMRDGKDYRHERLLNRKQELRRVLSGCGSSAWFKTRNPRYWQWAGREELFDRKRSREPVPGWHSCVIACSELEAIV
jgi:hypothetical protein